MILSEIDFLIQETKSSIGKKILKGIGVGAGLGLLGTGAYYLGKKDGETDSKINAIKAATDTTNRIINDRVITNINPTMALGSLGIGLGAGYLLTRRKPIKSAEPSYSSPDINYKD
jgi:ElaB/YqjD/DUF883 family membrane-anchored ribosome-binding protein